MRFKKQIKVLKKSYRILFKKLNHYKNLTKIPTPGKKKIEAELRKEINDVKKRIVKQIKSREQG